VTERSESSRPVISSIRFSLTRVSLWSFKTTPAALIAQ
jgi:hypothetical protein